MWIVKKKNNLRAYERFYDDLTGKSVCLTVIIPKDTKQCRKDAAIELHKKWEARQEKRADFSLSEIGEMYFSHIATYNKEQTVLRDSGQFRIVLGIIGDVKIDKVTAAYVKKQLDKTCKPNVTLNSYIKILKIVLRWAYKNGHTDNISVVDRLQKYPDASNRDKIIDKYMDNDELTLLVDSMERDYWALLTQFLALTGMRIGEAIALTDDDINIAERTININKTYSQTIRKISTAKTLSSVREIHIQPELLPIIMSIRKYSNETRLITGARNNLFFANPSNGKYVIYDVYEKYLRENGQRVLGRKITAHVLRHTFTSIMASKGVSLEQISRQLGHSNSTITRDVYYHVTKEQQMQDAAVLDKISVFG